METEAIPFDLCAAREALFEDGSSFRPVLREQIVGIDEVVALVDDLVCWLNAAEQFDAYNARLEPGILFEGPSGTGKTFVARYLATEADAVFVDVRDFPRNGPALDAADVAALFSCARAAHAEACKPVVLFWDEFHELMAGPPGAIGSVLAELDGVRGRSPGVLLVASTSRPQALVAPLLRPGRLGLRIPFRAPDEQGRLLLLERKLTEIELAGSIDLEPLKPLLGPELTAAAIEQAVSTAWQAAVRRAIRNDIRPALRKADLEAALLDGLLGPRPPFVRLDPEEQLAVAVHECGHAVVAAVLGVPLRLVTLRAGRSELGRMVTRARHEQTSTIAELRALVCVALAGAEAERVSGIEPGAGGHGDTGMATSLALQLVDLHGVGRRSGAVNPNSAYQRQVSVELSEHALARLDRDVADLLRRARRDARRILRRVGRGPIVSLAELLVERETMLAPELEREIHGLIGHPLQYAWRGRRLRSELRAARA